MAGLYTSTVYGPKSTVTRLDKIEDIGGVYSDAKLDFKYHMHEKNKQGIYNVRHN